MTQEFAGVELVFFDPDNGLEVKSRPYGRRHSSKYLYWHELVACYESGCSILVYKHFCHEGRAKFIRRLARQVQQRTGANRVYSFRTPRFVFFLAPQPSHAGHLAEGVEALRAWEPHIVCRIRNF